jgi:aspartyl-tRNA(Asn)/glutamyl-tRNA(Gln) amidotransferase subunit C
MISDDTVTHVARLARLALSEEEVPRYTKDLGRILHLIDELSDLDSAGIDAPVVMDEPTLLRHDAPQDMFERDVLMSNAPHAENGFFRVPQILEVER